MNNLHHGIPPTPDLCRDAVLQAVSTYREEEIPVKKRYTTLLIAAMLILLLCGTACAFTLFSVRDMVEDPSNAFEQSLVSIGQTQSSHGLTVTLGDAVFDGSIMLAALQMETAEGMQPLYVFPRLEAHANGLPLDIDGGLDDASSPDPLDFTTWTFGRMFPSVDTNYLAPETVVCKGFSSEVIGQAVQWTLHLDLYTPNWPLMDSATIPVTNRDDYFEAVRTIYEQGCIATLGGNLDEDWIDWLFLGEDDIDIPLTELLTKTGAFSLSDTLTYTFSTPVFQPKTFSDDTVHQMDGFTIEVTDLHQTFLTLEYTLLFRYDECQIPDDQSTRGAAHDLDVVYLPEGMAFRSGTIDLADDGLSATYQGSVQYISDEPLTELTFVLDPRWTHTHYDEYPSFTVKLAP